MMRARTKVLLETREENFGGLDAAADQRAAFKNEHAIACLGEVRGTDEAVVPRARHHIVEDLRTRCTRTGLPQHGCERERCERRGLHEIAASGQSHCTIPSV